MAQMFIVRLSVIFLQDTGEEGWGREGAGQDKPHCKSATHSSDQRCCTWESKHPHRWQAQVSETRKSSIIFTLHFTYFFSWSYMPWIKMIRLVDFCVFRFQAPGRDEESESQRKARSRLLRQTRRSTQVLLTRDGLSRFFQYRFLKISLSLVPVHLWLDLIIPEISLSTLYKAF